MFSLEVLNSLAGVAATVWDALTPPDEPFLEHAFLMALENSGSVGAGTGWSPFYLLVYQTVGEGRVLAGACAAYLKTHSYGEYVFDFAWANAWHSQGVPYYPPLAGAVPFTPATAPRRGGAGGLDRAVLFGHLLAGLRALARETGASGEHLLFVSEEEKQWLTAQGWTDRMGLQFHWRNRGYGDFDDFLGDLNTKRRKETRRERRLAGQTGLGFETLQAGEAPDEVWRAMARFYENTVDRKGGAAYLTPQFFDLMRDTYAHRAVISVAWRGGAVAGAALNFQKGGHLYGRYWGADEDTPCLHFELCYYQGIEHAIRHGLALYEAGAQGEHKLARGFLATPTYSCHALGHKGLARAVRDFTLREKHSVVATIGFYSDHTPFKSP